VQLIMNKQHNTLKLNASQVLDLIKSCLPSVEDSSCRSDQANRELLMELMAEKCQIAVSPGEEDATLLDCFKTQMLHYSGNSVKDLLADPHTSLVLIWHLKDRFKEQSSCSASQAERHIAIALYFAAIAHALVCHECMITQYDQSYLLQSFKQLAQKRWMLGSLRDLYLKASEHCERNPG